MKNLLLLLFLSCFALNAQNVDIQNIKIIDSSLASGIKDFIKLTKSNNSLFSKYGYVEIRLLSSFEMHKTIAKTTYRIKDQYVSLNESSSYPLFYTYILDKLILFYLDAHIINDNGQLSKKSKKIIAKKVEEFLKPIEHVIAKDSIGNIVIDDKNFREEIYNLHGGMLLNIGIDGKYELVIPQNN